MAGHSDVRRVGGWKKEVRRPPVIESPMPNIGMFGHRWSQCVLLRHDVSRKKEASPPPFW